MRAFRGYGLHLRFSEAKRTAVSYTHLRRKTKAALRRKKDVLKPVAVILIAVFVVLAGFLFLEKRTYRNYKVQVTSEQEDTVSTQYTYLSDVYKRQPLSASTPEMSY